MKRHLALASLFATFGATAEAAPMTGEWGGRRTMLAERGLSIDADLFLDVTANVAGGRRRGADVLGLVDVVVAYELDAVGWSGGLLLLDLLGIFGGSPSMNVGDVQATNNIEAPSTVTVYRAYFEQQLFDDRVAILVGLYALDWEFDIAPSAELFVHSSFGTGGDIGNSGRIGPSIYAATGLGVRVAWRPFEDVVLRAVVADGVPHDPDHRAGSRSTCRPTRVR